jgi:hypothetical protein
MNSEFVKQTLRENLARVLVPHIADGLWSVYDSAKTACQRNQQPEKTLQTFQNLLTRIPQWSSDTLEKEVDRITIASKCDYIEDLLLGVFVSYIRAFASLQQVDATHVSLDFERPTLQKFIHTYYIHAARKSWSQAYLFNTIQVSSEQRARNSRDIEAMLESTMNEVIDSFIPWRQISKSYFTAPTAPAPAPAPAPTKPVQFAEENEVHEFETEDEEESDYDSELEDRPKLTLGEEIKLDLDEDDKSVNTEDELDLKIEKSDTISLNI